MPPITDFSSSFNDPDRADVLLHLSTSVQVSEDSQPQADAADSSVAAQSQHRTPGSIVRTYHLHSLLLAHHSHYFKTRLAKSWPQSDSRKRRRDDTGPATAATEGAPRAVATGVSSSGGGGGSGDGSSSLTEVTELVEEAELEAMHELLKLMYSQKVPSDAPAELLLKCLRLADRYQAAACTDLLLSHLSAQAKDLSTYDIAVQMFSLPQGVQHQAAFHNLLGTFKQQVVDRFRNVPDVIRSDALRQQFCDLPFAAVLAWVQSDMLQVHSENCVVYLLSAWVTAQKVARQSISAEQLEQLAHQVRVLHLGPAYQFFVLSNLEWFKGCSGMPCLPTLLAYKGVNDRGVSVFPARKCSEEDSLAWEWEGPAAWVADARQPVSPAHRGPGSPECSLSWELGPAELQELSGEATLSCKANVYANGFQLHCSLGEKSKEGSSSPVTLGMYFDVSCEAMAKHGVPWPEAATVPIEGVTFKVRAPSETNAEVSKLVRTRSSSDRTGFGFPDFLDRSAPTLQELVAPMLIDGKLCVEMKVSGVDLLPT